MNTKLNFFFLRLPIAMSLLGHGLVRLPKLAAFSNWMVGSMAKSVFPPALVTAFSYALPILEAVLGLLLLLGIRVQYTLYGGLVLMSILIAGSSSVEDWAAIQAQLVHAVYLGFLLYVYGKAGFRTDRQVDQ